MQFKHPEILYALLLIIIPIIVHLFQLQRFTKTPFTNVAFLKKLELQTRKSSRLKKWLILLTRILAFSALIFAFSQPFFSDKKINQKYATTIYLDNSLSMQLKTQEGELLKNAAQKIIKNATNQNKISLVTNDKIFKNLNPKELKNELINVNYSSKTTDFNTVLLKINQLNLSQSNAVNNIILISDFQNINSLNKSSVTNVNSRFSLINVAPSTIANVTIDTLYISKTTNKEITLKIQLKNINIEDENFPISIYNDKLLIAKTTTTLLKNKPSTVEIKIPNQENSNGKVVIDDENLTFDNTLFFTISKPEKINVLSVGKSEHFLSKIYTKNEFNFTQKNLRNLDYNSIKNQNLIILSKLDKIPNSFSKTLSDFITSGGNIAIIPSENINTDSYNQLFNQLQLGTINKFTKKELKITTINYAHPILNDVFEKRVKNFQYPTVKSFYTINKNASSSILSYENEQPFITEIKKKNSSVYLFSAPINKENSNFTNSPLVVPLFYNFGKVSFKIPQLYYTIGKENKIAIKALLKKDEIVKITNETEEFIPLQQVYHNKVQLSLNEQPSLAGFYKITNKNKPLRTISFNYNRNESNLNYTNLSNLFKDSKNVSISNSIENTLTQLSNQQQIKPLFKWFLGLSILFLLLEILILKFFKT